MAFIAISAQICWQKFFFLKCLLSGPLPNIYFLSNPLNQFIGYMGDEAVTLQKCSGPGCFNI